MQHPSQVPFLVLVSLTLMLGGCATRDLRGRVDVSDARLAATDRALRDLETRACELEMELQETQVAYDDAARENRELGAEIVLLRATLTAVERERRDDLAAMRAESNDRDRQASARVELTGAKIAMLEREIADRDARLALKEVEAAELDRSIAALESNTTANGAAIESLAGEKAAMSADLEAALASRTKIALLLGALLLFFIALSIGEFVAVRRARHAHAH